MESTEGLPLEVRLSALIDGEVNEAEKKELEALIATDEDARGVYDTLVAGSNLGNKAFEEILHDPVPLALVRRIKQGPGVSPRAERVTDGPARLASSALWPKALAASLVLLVAGGTAGYIIGQDSTGSPAALQVASRSWLDDVADYHRVYSRPGERLVEVPASEGDAAITAWLANSTGVDFTLPDVTASGLKFEGARLVVASGKPVAQLMYRNTSGQVVAICFQESGANAQDMPLKATRRGDLELISWGHDKAVYVVVAPSNTPGLTDLAKSVSTSI